MATVSVVVALFFALMFYAQWDTYLRFRYGGSFGLPDPLFGVDTGFYLFRLPFYELLQNSLAALALVAFLAALITYAFLGLLQFSRTARLKEQKTGVPHLSALLFFLVASWGWGFYLDHFELLYSNLGVVHGAGYTADHAIGIALWVMVGAAAALCALLVLNFFRPRIKTMVVGSGIYVALYIIAILMLPGFFQRFMVQPNELALESSYLKNNIEFTRKAYKLNSIQETSYPALLDLTPDMIARSQDTIRMSTPATREREAFRWIVSGKGFYSPGPNPTSIFCSPPICSRRAGFRSGGRSRSAWLRSLPFCNSTTIPTPC